MPTSAGTPRSGASAAARRLSAGSSTVRTISIDIWEGVPRPVLGAFEITVRGPLGRGLRRTIFVAEGLSVAYQPKVRLLTGVGLAAGAARLAAAPGATAQPRVPALRARRARAARSSTARPTESEPLVITPPHVAVLCPAAGVTTWTTSLVHLVDRGLRRRGPPADPCPGSRPAPGQVTRTGHPDQLELAVLVRGQQVQAIAASGQQSPGLAGFELARAADTVAAHGHAELALDLGSGAHARRLRPSTPPGVGRGAGRGHAGAARRHRGGRADRWRLPRLRALAPAGRAARRRGRHRSAPGRNCRMPGRCASCSASMTRGPYPAGRRGRGSGAYACQAAGRARVGGPRGREPVQVRGGRSRTAGTDEPSRLAVAPGRPGRATWSRRVRARTSPSR